ncbi:hypothetical protein [Plantactinospora sp. BB1]|uniref:hypothetical protein n=1 Tax=Plantactinospora sp. BB1 TaxID=2071627 RepID=UPI00131F4511|nr:hypothetical protein [Plantactinospora sp. BB1]
MQPDGESRPAANRAALETTGGTSTTTIPALTTPARWRRVEVDRGRGWSVVRWERH